MTETEYLTQGGLAQMLQVCVTTLQKTIRRPDFPRPIRIGKSRRWSKAEVEEYLRKDRERGCE
jgi:predicted DNA-binding transcriptional regulator AlpA